MMMMMICDGYTSSCVDPTDNGVSFYASSDAEDDTYTHTSTDADILKGQSINYVLEFRPQIIYIKKNGFFYFMQ